jgi:hypothetical protein
MLLKLINKMVYKEPFLVDLMMNSTANGTLIQELLSV